MADQTRFIPVPQWEKYHSWPSKAALRALIFKAKENGFDKVVKRIGRRVLIDENAFLDWVEDQNKPKV